MTGEELYDKFDESKPLTRKVITEKYKPKVYLWGPYAGMTKQEAIIELLVHNNANITRRGLEEYRIALDELGLADPTIY